MNSAFLQMRVNLSYQNEVWHIICFTFKDQRIMTTDQLVVYTTNYLRNKYNDDAETGLIISRMLTCPLESSQQENDK